MNRPRWASNAARRSPCFGVACARSRFSRRNSRSASTGRQGGMATPVPGHLPPHPSGQLLSLGHPPSRLGAAQLSQHLSDPHQHHRRRRLGRLAQRPHRPLLGVGPWVVPMGHHRATFALASTLVPLPLARVARRDRGRWKVGALHDANLQVWGGPGRDLEEPARHTPAATLVSQLSHRISRQCWSAGGFFSNGDTSRPRASRADPLPA
jgi:hypothetical protein